MKKKTKAQELWEAECNRAIKEYGQIMIENMIELLNKEPCKHEPMEYMFRQGYFLGPEGEMRKTESKSEMFSMKCKHCGVKIKAEKWVEA